MHGGKDRRLDNGPGLLPRWPNGKYKSSVALEERTLTKIAIKLNSIKMSGRLCMGLDKVSGSTEKDVFKSTTNCRLTYLVQLLT